MYSINFFKNIRDNTVQNTQVVSMDGLYDALAEVHGTNDRDKVKLFNLCSYKTTDYRPATYKIFVDGVDTGETGFKTNTTTNQPAIGRYRDNVIEVCGLILDYDGNGAVLTEYQQLFSGFEHMGYTSYNHAIKGVDKFRFVFPFATACPVDEWIARKDDMLAFATEKVDPTTCDLSRMFYTPCYPIDAKEHFKWFENRGVLLEWQCFNKTERPAPETYQYEPIQTDKDLSEILNTLASVYPLPDYNLRFRLTRAVAKLIGKEAAIQEMRTRWPDHSWNGKYEAILSGPLRSDGPGLGTLVHEIRTKLPSYSPPPAIKRDQLGFSKLPRSIFL